MNSIPFLRRVIIVGILDARCQMLQVTGCRLQVAGCRPAPLELEEAGLQVTGRLHVARCWMLDAGYWMLDAGSWILDPGYWSSDHKS